MDLTQLTDEQVAEELGGMLAALDASLGWPFDGREKKKDADLREKIESYRAELDRRNALRS